MSLNIGSEKSEIDAKLEFEDSRREFAQDLFERENSRKDLLETKAQFYLSFLAIFVGAIFFNIDYLEWLVELLASGNLPQYMVVLIHVVISLLLLSLLTALISVVESMRLRDYKSAFPNEPSLSLFDPKSRYSGYEDKSTFLRSCALNYTVALEHNNETNDRKAEWVTRCSFLTLASVLLLVALIGLSLYASL